MCGVSEPHTICNVYRCNLQRTAHIATCNAQVKDMMRGFSEPLSRIEAARYIFARMRADDPDWWSRCGGERKRRGCRRRGFGRGWRTGARAGA